MGSADTFELAERRGGTGPERPHAAVTVGQRLLADVLKT
jgi:hypothetical protein